MADPVGHASFLGIGLENTAGTPVKSQVELDFISESLRGVGEPIRRRSINRTRAVKGAVMGPYRIEGDLNLEVTPDKITKLLYAALIGIATAGTIAPFTHTFKPGAGLKPLTAQLLRDDQYFVYPGLHVSRLTFRGVIDQILEATVGLAAKGKERIYNAEQSDVAIAASTLDPFVFHQGVVTLHGAANTDTNNWEISIDTGLQTPKGLGAGRAPNRAHAGDNVVTGSFDLVFDTVEAHRRWMGASSSAYPILVADTLQTFALQLKYTAGANAELTIDIPKAYYTASEPSVQGRDGVIIQRCQFGSLYDVASLADVVLTVKNAEAAASITGLGTDI
ncbi:MAG: phage tail tube protein [Armatimonadota bacterium]